MIRKKSGRQNLYSVDFGLPLRHYTKQLLVEDLQEDLTKPC